MIYLRALPPTSAGEKQSPIGSCFELHSVADAPASGRV